MAISKERKETLVEQYKELLNDSNGLVITSFSGVTVKQLEALRRKIRDVGGQFFIVKNTLMGLAMEETGIRLPEEVLIGTTAVGFAWEDIPGVAKAIADLASCESDTMDIKGGLIDKIAYDATEVKRFADLPPLPILQAQLLSMIQAPASRVAMVLSSSIRQVVNVTKAYADTGAAEAESPA